jgi:dimethylglycine dehydrogenase
MRWFEAHLPDRGVTLRSLRPEMVGLSIAGPRARDLLQRLTHHDVSTKSFPFLSFREMELGMIPAKVGRMTFTGDLGYELWVTADYQLALYGSPARSRAGLRISAGGRRTRAAGEELGHLGARVPPPIYGPFDRARSLRRSQQGGFQRPRRGAEGKGKRRQAASRDARRRRSPPTSSATSRFGDAARSRAG